MLWSSLSYVYSQALGGINAAWIGVARAGRRRRAAAGRARCRAAADCRATPAPPAEGDTMMITHPPRRMTRRRPPCCAVRRRSCCRPRRCARRRTRQPRHAGRALRADAAAGRGQDARDGQGRPQATCSTTWAAATAASSSPPPSSTAHAASASTSTRSASRKPRQNAQDAGVDRPGEVHGRRPVRVRLLARHGGHAVPAARRSTEAAAAAVAPAQGRHAAWSRTTSTWATNGRPSRTERVANKTLYSWTIKPEHKKRA